MLLAGSLARRGRGRPWRSAAVRAALAICLALPGGSVLAQDTGSRRAPGASAVTRLPAGYLWVDEGQRRYAFHDGLFFQWVPRDRHFEQIAAPVGTAVPAPPRGARVARIRGITYHVYRGVFYKATRRNGRTVYVVAKV